MSRKHHRHPAPPAGPATTRQADGKPVGEVLTPIAPTPGEDVNVRVIVRFGLALGLVTVLVAAALLVFMQMLEERAAARDPQRPPISEAAWERQEDLGLSLRKPEGGVHLQRQPFADIEALTHAEAEHLDKYGWVDRGAGVVHIPIKDAMRHIVRRGLPVRGRATPSPAAATPTPSTRPTAARATPAARRGPAARAAAAGISAPPAAGTGKPVPRTSAPQTAMPAPNEAPATEAAPPTTAPTAGSEGGEAP